MKRKGRGPRALPAAVAGFSLIELLAALAILSILISVAVPGFLDKLRKARRADAMEIATQVAHAQERWRGNNASYSGQLVTELGLPSTSTGGYYSLSLSNNSTIGYTLTASAVSGKSQAADTGCTSLVMTVQNGSPAYTPQQCWAR